MKNIKWIFNEPLPMEMHKARIVQKINLLEPKKRLEAIKEAGFNTFLLKNHDVFLDMLTDSGVNAMSDKQQAAMLQADDSYAGSETFFRLEAAIQKMFGMKFFLPAHQGRACEHIISKALVNKGQAVLMNYHFTTSKAHVVLEGGFVEELITDEGLNLNSTCKFKGNIDIDKNLCFAAVASNMLHWWFDQNIENVDNYIVKNGDIIHANRQLSDLKASFESQEESKIFELYKVLYGYNERGFYTDLLVDLFINGYTPKLSGATNIERDDLVPDNNGGFFYDVFKEKKLTDRTYGGRYESLSENLKLELGRGGLVGLSHKVFSRNNHIVTLWGAEYDLNGKLKAVYVSDSDDQDESNVGMKRYEVRNMGGIAKVSTNITDKSAGAAVGYLHILYLGTNQWNDYFR